MKLSLAIQTPEVPQTVPIALLMGTVSEKLDKAAAWGADGLELMTADPGALDAAEVQADLGRRGLVAAAVGTGAVAGATGLTLMAATAEARQAALERLFALIRFAAAIGAPVVTVGAFRGRVSVDGPDGPEHLADSLRAAAELASGYGLRLALEPVNRYEVDFVHTLDEALEFRRRVGHPALSLLLDTFHANIEERSPLGAFERAMREGCLLHVHLGDNNRLAPGWGAIDFPAMLACLHHGGYDAFLSAELLPRPDPDTAAHQTLAHMRQLLADLG